MEFGFAAEFFHGRISLMSGLPWGEPLDFREFEGDKRGKRVSKQVD